ncbi:MAG: hypothetical protein MZV64_41390 [Ignavibacteriales bacterium]|nr:hypothetical protein [Ignavibacteriales bacterium]
MLMKMEFTDLMVGLRGLFQQREDMRIGADFDLTSQLDNHLLEFGFGVEQHTIRGYGNLAYIVAGLS